jgi:hypothetical protein
MGRRIIEYPFSISFVQELNDSTLALMSSFFIVYTVDIDGHESDGLTLFVIDLQQNNGFPNCINVLAYVFIESSTKKWVFL